MENIKFKILTKDQLIIAVDRLTRFKNPQAKYLRVFTEIISSNLIFPSLKKVQIENLDYEEIKNIAEMIINKSITELLGEEKNDNLINKKLLEYEKRVFKCNKEVEKLINNKINYKSFVKLVNETSPKNLKWLKTLSTGNEERVARLEKGLRYPIEKVVIAEGATEETLLPEFGKLLGYDFDRHGVYIISAGGKNQVVKLYYKLVDIINLPIFVLLDKDADENLKQIQPKLRKIDKIHILESGEFEDLLPIDLIKRTLDYSLNNLSIIEPKIFEKEIPMAKKLEEIYKTRGHHEFKKVEFAQMVKLNIKTKGDTTTEISNIIEEIEKL